MTGMLRLAVALIFVFISQLAFAAYTVSTIPNKTFKTLQEAEAEMRGKSIPESHLKLNYSSITDNNIYYYYSVPKQQPVIGQAWAYDDVYSSTCYATESELVAAFEAVNNSATSPCPRNTLSGNAEWKSGGVSSTSSNPYMKQCLPDSYYGEGQSKIYDWTYYSFYYSNSEYVCTEHKGKYSLQRFRPISCPEGFTYQNPGTYNGVYYQYGACNSSATASITGSFEQYGFCPEGNPCYPSTGRKVQKENDLTLGDLELYRTFHSLNQVQSSGALGQSWHHNHAMRLNLSNGALTGAIRADGFVEPLKYKPYSNPAEYNSYTKNRIKAVKTSSGWTLRTTNNDTEYYDANGKLLQIIHSGSRVTIYSYNAKGLLDRVETDSGEYLQFAYDQSGAYLIAVEDSAGRTVNYEYDVKDNLNIVHHQDGTMRSYHYEDTRFPSHLTGITDEQGVRFATFLYNDNGKVVTSTHIDNVGRIDLIYNTDSNVTVRNSRGREKIYNFGTVGNYIRVPKSIDIGTTKETFEYYPPEWGNPQLRLLRHTDASGQKTEYGAYDGNGNPGYKTVAAGTPQARKINYTYDPRFFSKVATRTEPSVCPGQNKVTSYAYDNYGNATSLTINGYTNTCTAVSRTINLQYNGPLNQLSQIDGPRTDVSDITTFDYYANDPSEGFNRGRLRRVISGGLVLRDNLQYTATGKLASEVRANGLAMTYTYYPGNDRLETVTESDGSSSRATRWTYLATGEVETITLGHGTSEAITITLGYDAARRLTSIRDAAGNRIEYTLDTEGNREGERVYDASNQLHRALTQTFDAYNRLDTSAQMNENSDVNFAPDGTLDTAIDGKGKTTDYNYDALKRLISSTQDLGSTDSATANALTQYGYDVQDNLTQVTDPANGKTTYEYDDLGNLLKQVSPDTGTTLFSYDPAGNVQTRTDAKGQIFTYTYDALNRVTFIDAPYPLDDLSYHYDTCPNGTGRLCSVTQGGEVTGYSYTAFGDVSVHQNVQYSYDSLGRLADVMYPSGNQISYQYDGNGRILRVDAVINGVPQTLAANIGYAPFGPLTQLTYGNGATLTQDFDQAYRMIAQTIPGIYQRSYPLYDGNGNLQSINDTLTAANDAYDYDALNRLISASGSTVTELLGYDKNGNRLSQTSGAQQSTYSYTTNSNRLSTHNGAAIQIDANGNTLADANHTYSYNSHNQLTGVNADVAYTYNALGQRVSKTVTGVLTTYVYDTAGQLLGEYGADGSVTEHVYLNGQPIAVIKEGNVYYVHTDHLGTPRAISNASQTVVWTWASDPFGAMAANDDPDGDSVAFVYNKRYPGQYYDAETGLHYNYFRYYDPSTGRYITSDPIGLGGGTNTYAYAGDNPIGYMDPFGLSYWGLPDGLPDVPPGSPSPGGTGTVPNPNPNSANDPLNRPSPGAPWYTRSPGIMMLFLRGSAAIDYPEWYPYDGESHPEKFDEDEALNCPNDGDGDDFCKRVGWSIDVLQRQLRFRRWDMQRQPIGPDPGHITRYNNVVQRLKALIDLAEMKKCKYNPSASWEAGLNWDYPTSWY